MVRCYDCGKPIPDEQIIRRDIRVGESRSCERSYYHYSRVNLCPACAAQRANTVGKWIIEIGEQIMDWIMKSKARRITLILYCFFTMILFFCLFFSIVISIVDVHKTAKLKNNKTVQTSQVDNKPTTLVFKKGDRFHLSGTITKVEVAYVRFSGAVALDITIRHSGVPGVLTPGTWTFRAYDAPEGALNIKVRDLDKLDKSIGRKVDFVIEWHDQWILVELVGKKSK
jgi:hypothetical protein